MAKGDDSLETYDYTFDYDVGQVTSCVTLRVLLQRDCFQNMALYNLVLSILEHGNHPA